jgi:malic enzyme
LSLLRESVSQRPISTCECNLYPLNHLESNHRSEDFGLPNARRILDKYQEQIPCFNDDIQGTGCVTLAAMMAALHVSDVKLDEVRVVIFGSGTAGTGIADQIADTIATETNKSKEEASKQIWSVFELALPTF